MRRRFHYVGAFTLIELVSVIVILGIVAAAVGGPTMSYLNSVRARSAGARIVADLRYVQRHAMSSRLRTWAVFDAAAENYQLYAENPLNPGEAHRQALPHPLDQSTGPVQLGSGAFAGVGISSVGINGTSELEFDSFGVPYDGNGAVLGTNGTVTLTNGVTVTIHPVSGFAEQSG